MNPRSDYNAHQKKKAKHPCKQCGAEFTPSPPMSERKGPDGRPMTTKQGLALFRPGGVCIDCQISNRSASARGAMRKRRERDEKAKVVVSTYRVKLA